MHNRQKKLLLNILSQPSAPFREMHVRDLVFSELDNVRIPYFADPAGNIIIGADSKEKYFSLLKNKTKEPLRIYMAHMDHPGFHGTKWITANRLQIQWHGGAPVKRLNKTPIWTADETGWFENGTLTKAKLDKNKTTIDTAEVHFKSKKTRGKNPEASKLFGGFRFSAPVWENRGIIYTKAADDLVGVFAVLSLALELKKKYGKIPGNFIGLLTRAEEVGFVGAFAHFKLDWFKQARRPLLCISLETSRTLPGAHIGKGPVIRLGDRLTVFDPKALRIFRSVAEKHLKNGYQIRIMDGGTCEASVSMAFSVPCVGISIPLGNYHNQSFEGGPDSRGPDGPAPEFVHVKDVTGMVKLCHALLDKGLPWNDPWRDLLKRLNKKHRDYRAFL